MKERFRMRPSRYVDLVRACAVKISNISRASWPTWNSCPAARSSNPDQTRPAILDLMQVPERVNTLRHLFSPVPYSYAIYIVWGAKWHTNGFPWHPVKNRREASSKAWRPVSSWRGPPPETRRGWSMRSWRKWAIRRSRQGWRWSWYVLVT